MPKQRKIIDFIDRHKIIYADPLQSLVLCNLSGLKFAKLVRMDSFPFSLKE
jgi:hypothetical protein